MKERNQELAKKLLKPHRQKIDVIDQKILKLIGQRFGVVRNVAKIKIKHDIPAFIGDRVEQVREGAVGQGKKYGIAPDFIRTLYTLIIYQSCATEELMKLDFMRAKKKPAQKKTSKKKK